MAEPKKAQYVDFLKHNPREYGMLISLITIMVFFQVMTQYCSLKLVRPEP